MAKHGYGWEPGNTPPTIEAHSLAKHEVLQRYLLQYLRVLTSNILMDGFSITLVDAFAGGGLYCRADNRDLHEGSPLIMLRTVDEARRLIQDGRRKPFVLDARFIFVEAKREVRAFLEDTLRARGFAPEQNERVRVLEGTFEGRLDEILATLRTRGNRRRRSIFLLDQYGYVDASIPAIRKIFDSDHRAEVILTFAVDWMLDYMTESKGTRSMLRRLGVELDPAQLRAKLDSNPNQAHGQIQRNLLDAIVERSGAKYFTPFFIRSPKAHRSYWLLHLSGHPAARDEMTQLHWACQNTFQHFGGAGLNMLGFDPREENQGFLFDKDAERRTLDAVAEDAVRCVYEQADGVVFSKLFEGVCNETPATKEMVRASLLQAHRHGRLALRREGKLLERGQSIQDADLLIVPRQLTMFGSKNK